MVLLHRRDARDNNAGGEELRELHGNFLEWMFTILAWLKGFTTNHGLIAL
jgi:hypothetical protein